MRRTRLLILVILASSAVFIFLAAAHLRLARANREAEGRSLTALFSVRDQVLRYEVEHGRLPETLDDLVPRYLRIDQIREGAEGGRPVYVYSRKHRSLSDAKGPVRGGIFGYRRRPRVAELLEAPEPTTPPEVTGTPPEPVQVPEITKLPAPPAPPPGPPERPVAPAQPPARRPAELIRPRAPKLPAPPGGAFVFEAEHFSEMNYGWEAHLDPACAGGAYIHTKEGTGNGPGQKSHGVKEFYNVQGSKEFFLLRYHFRLEKAGTYYVYGLFWTTDTHCSNNMNAAIDADGTWGSGFGNRTPFRWRWSNMGGNPRAFAAGDHYLHIFIHEDGIKMDQFILSPSPMFGDQRYRANLKTGEGTAWLKTPPPPLHLSFDLKSMIIDPELPPDCRLVLRRLREAEGTADVTVKLRGAGPGGEDLVIADQTVDLAELAELSFMPLPLKRLDLGTLRRREYLLTAAVRQGGRGGEELAAARVPLMRPWAWQVFGPGGYLSQDTAAALDGDGSPAPADKRRWTPFKVSSFDLFGVLDFGVQTIGNSLHAPQMKTIYARTRVRVPRTGKYLLKIQADDQMLLWLDGRQVYRHDHRRPVTRASTALPLELGAGEHRMRMRVNQQSGRWQAHLRIRTEDDRVSGVVGLEPPSAPPPPPPPPPPPAKD